MAKTIHETRKDILVFHDPAARNPAFRDAADGVNPWDWTYTTPNALTLPYKLEVLRAMAKPGNDSVCNYVQVLWKASVASEKDECPSSSILRLGLLHSMSRPVGAIGHWNTEWMRAPGNRDRWEAVRDLAESLWQPLGPVFTNLRQNSTRNVAFLLSHTNELFAAKLRETWRKESYYAAWHEAFLRAGLPVDVVFEEDVVDGKLADYRAVFIPDGELIGKKAHERLVAFTEKGGKVVADHNLGYKIPNAILLATNLDFMYYPTWAYSQVKGKTGVAAPERRTKMREATNELARVFAAERAVMPAAGDTCLILTQREWHGVRYLFAVNDARAPGDQVGNCNVVEEEGRPLTTTISAPGTNAIAAVYDLARHREVKTSKTNDGMSWTVDLPPASAALYALLPQKIAELRLAAPSAAVRRGGALKIGARILDDVGQPVKGLVPLQLVLKDSHGAVSEYSDYFVAKDGAWELEGAIALNDAAGEWSVRVEDLASGTTAACCFRVE